MIYQRVSVRTEITPKTCHGICTVGVAIGSLPRGVLEPDIRVLTPMSQKSKWVETSYEVGGAEIVLPLRCCVEVRKNRIRTLLQRFDEAADRWELAFKSHWVPSPNAHRAPLDKLDEAAFVIADTIEDVVGEEVLRNAGFSLPAKVESD